jgi:LysR family transcriptional regulator, hydrogen peroxide-inducible genes activator
VERARRLLVDAADLVEASRRLADPLAGTVRLGVIPTVSPYLLPAAARALRQRYPRLSVVWVEDKTAVLIGGLAAGTLDGAILSLETKLGDVEHEVLASDAFVLATPARHPLGVPSSPARPEALRGGGVLLLDEGHCLREQALAVCSLANAQELEFRATSLPTLAQMVAGGAGVTLLQLLSVPLESRRARLLVRPFAEPAPRGRSCSRGGGDPPSRAP